MRGSTRKNEAARELQVRPSTRVLPDRPLAGLVVCLVDSDIRSVTLVSIVRPFHGEAAKRIGATQGEGVEGLKYLGGLSRRHASACDRRLTARAADHRTCCARPRAVPRITGRSRSPRWVQLARGRHSGGAQAVAGSVQQIWACALLQARLQQHVSRLRRQHASCCMPHSM